jgi:hypothetical protein
VKNSTGAWSAEDSLLCGEEPSGLLSILQRHVMLLVDR